MPKKVDHQERRELIAAALMRVVADQGLEAVSLRQVAAEAGVTGGMVQHYFPNKDTMMDFAMKAASSGYEQRIEAAMAELGEAPSPVQSAETILGCLLPATEQERRDARVALAFMSYSAARTTASESLAADNTGMQGVIADLLRSAQAAGTAPEDRNPDAVGIALMAMTDGLGIHIISAGLSHQTAAAVLRSEVRRAFGED